MIEKIKEILSSVRFWQISGASLSAYLADISLNGFQVSRLLMALSLWLGIIAGVGTVDKLGNNLKK